MPSPDPSLNFRHQFSARTMGHLASNDSWSLDWPQNPELIVHGLELAVRLTATVLSSHAARDLNEKYCFFLFRFLGLLDQSSQAPSEWLLANDFKTEIQEKCGPYMENFLWALKLCRGRGLIPLPAAVWPQHLMGMGHFILQRCNAEQATIAAAYMEQLLSGAVMYGKVHGSGDSVTPDDLPIILKMVCGIAETYRRHIPATPNWVRVFELIDLGKSIVEASEKKFGVSTEPAVMYNKGMLYFASAAALIESRKVRESKVEMQRSMELISNFYKHLDSTNLGSFTAGEDADQTRRWEGFVRDAGSGMVLTRFNEIWEQAAAEITGSRVEQGRRRIVAAGRPFLDRLSLLVHSGRRTAGTPYRLKLYEIEMERGNWSRAMSIHQRMMVQSMARFDMSQVREHLNFQEAIARENGVLGDFEERLQDAREATGLLQEFMSATEAGASAESLTEENFDAVNQFNTKVTAKYGVDMFAAIEINEIVRESLTRDRDPSLPHNAAPGVLSGWSGGNLMEELRPLFEQGEACAKDRGAGPKLMVNSATVLRTLRNLEQAEDASDVTAIYQHLDQLQRLSEDDGHRRYLIPGSVQSRRDWNTSRLLRDIWAETQRMADAAKEDHERLDAELCHLLLTKCRNISSLSGCSGEVRKALDDIQAILEGFYLNALLRKADEVRTKEKNTAKYVSLVGQVLELYHGGAFRRAMLQEHTRVSLNEHWNGYFRARVSLALDGSRWAEARRMYAEWRGLEELWEMEMCLERRKGTLDMESTILKMAGFEDLLMALQRLDMPLVNGRLQELRRLCDVTKSQASTDGAFTVGHDHKMLRLCERGIALTVECWRSRGPEAAQRLASLVVAEVRAGGQLFQSAVP